MALSTSPRLRAAFQSQWLAALIGAAIVAASLSLTGNLTVGGQADVTQTIIARSGVQLTSTSGPTIRTVASNPDGSVVGTRGDLRLRTDTAALYQNTNNGTGWTTIISAASDADTSLVPVSVHGACAFDGVATPVCDATLSGSTYTLQRDISATTITIANGVTVATNNWLVTATGDITCTGTAKFSNNGNAASGSTAGTATASHTFNATVAGVPGGTGAGSTGTASASVPLGFATAVVSQGDCSPANDAGSNGGTCQGGGGGCCSSCAAQGGRAGDNTVNTGGSYAWMPPAIFDGRDSSKATRFTMGATGGAGAGKVGSTGGGSGASAGWMTIIARSSNCPMEAKGGAGGNGQGTDSAGGGGAPGGIIIARFTRGSLPSADVSGGAAGVHAGSSGDGGAGGACISSVCAGGTCTTCVGGSCTTVTP